MRLWLFLWIAMGLAAAACGGRASSGPVSSPNPVGERAPLTVSSASPPAPTPSPAFLLPNRVPALSLTDIFPPRDLSALGLNPSQIRTLIATGDVIPARWVDRQIRQRGNDFLYPVAATQEITAAADLTMINLEAPFIEGCPPQGAGTFTFCGQPGFVTALQAAGVDVATLENNHIGNYGPSGIAATIDLLEAAGIAWADRYTPALREVRGLTFGFLAFNGVGEPIDRQAVASQIETLRPQVDILIVAFHWGAEYVSLPQPAPGVADDDPIEIAHLAVDAGADLIIGNHPHWVQAVELYKGKLITYAHGNFIFDQMWSYETRVGVIGRYTFYDEVLVGVEFIPMLIEDYSQPVPLKGAEAQAVLDGMRQASEELAGSGR